MGKIQHGVPAGGNEDLKWIELVIQQVGSLRYGVVEIVVHDFRPGCPPTTRHHQSGSRLGVNRFRSSLRNGTIVNWTNRIIFCALSVCLLAGCRTDEDVVMLSNQPQPPARSAEKTITQTEKLDHEDLLKIDRAVFACLLQRHFWDGNEYSAVFLRGDADEVAMLVKEFTNHIPPVKTLEHAELLPNRTPVDKDTNRPAMVLSVDVLDPVDGTAQAIGKWYGGGAVAGFYTFTLRRSGEEWLIESFK